MAKIEAPAIHTGKSKARYAKDFFREHDKGSSRPAFCYPSSIQTLREDTSKLEKLLSSRMIDPSREPELKARHRMLKKRLTEIDKQTNEIRKEIKEDSDYWSGRRKELMELIRENTPSKTDRQKKRVSPQEVIKREKGLKGKLPPLEHGGDSLTLQEAKKEFMIVSKAMDEDSNISFLEKE